MAKKQTTLTPRKSNTAATLTNQVASTTTKGRTRKVDQAPKKSDNLTIPVPNALFSAPATFEKPLSQQPTTEESITIEPTETVKAPEKLPE